MTRRPTVAGRRSTDGSSTRTPRPPATSTRPRSATRSPRGSASTWGPVHNGIAELAGIPEPLRKVFSTRRREIEEELARLGLDGARAAQTATLNTRRPKDRGEDIAVLHSRWREQTRALGHRSRRDCTDCCTPRSDHGHCTARCTDRRPDRDRAPRTRRPHRTTQRPSTAATSCAPGQPDSPTARPSPRSKARRPTPSRTDGVVPSMPGSQRCDDAAAAHFQHADRHHLHDPRAARTRTPHRRARRRPVHERPRRRRRRGRGRDAAPRIQILPTSSQTWSPTWSPPAGASTSSSPQPAPARPRVSAVPPTRGVPGATRCIGAALGGACRPGSSTTRPASRRQRSRSGCSISRTAGYGSTPAPSSSSTKPGMVGTRTLAALLDHAEKPGRRSCSSEIRGNSRRSMLADSSPASPAGCPTMRLDTNRRQREPWERDALHELRERQHRLAASTPIGPTMPCTSPTTGRTPARRSSTTGGTRSHPVNACSCSPPAAVDVERLNALARRRLRARRSADGPGSSTHSADVSKPATGS